jgi:hypothetical protein
VVVLIRVPPGNRRTTQTEGFVATDPKNTERKGGSRKAILSTTGFCPMKAGVKMYFQRGRAKKCLLF